MRGLCSFLLLFFILSATVSAQANFVFESADCHFPIPTGYTIDCGTLVVPEDYSHPANRQVRIAVAILRHPDGNPESDPIFYLEGGPGGSSLRFLHLIFPIRYEPLFVANRDIIVFDQRGVGLSEPNLDCNDFEALKIDHLDLIEADETISRRESEDRLRDSLIACGRSLALDYDLSMVNSAVNARDVESLRQALGYEQINLWGISYGTRLALTSMRDYPETIRSVVLDSAYPLEANIFTETPANWVRALDTLFASCASDSACNNSFPDLKTRFYATVDALNENPVRVTSYNPFTGERIHDVVLDGALFFELTIQLLYDTGSIPNLPQMISRVSEGDTSAYAYAIGRVFVQNAVFSYGMHYAVQCQEEMPFTDRATIEAMYAAQPDLQSLVDMGVTGASDVELCQRFNAGSPLAIANDAVKSDIPTLIFGGRFDPVTPPQWGLQVHDNLSSSIYLEIPTGGHGTTASEACPQSIAAEFFINPILSPNADCIAEMVLRFNGTLEEQEFVPVLEGFTNQQ